MNETTTLSAPMTTSFEDYSDEESLIFNISTGNGSIHGSGNLTEEERLQIQINSSFGAWLVFMEMTLALIGIVLNLTVVISIREKESLLNNTVNIILGNLCFANLVAAVFVKSIAVVFHGYAVARSRWEVELAFCTVHTITSRATWAVFPYTLLVLCWHGLALRAGQIIASVKENKLTSTTTDAPKGYLLGATGVMGTMDLPMSRSTTADIEGEKEKNIMEEEFEEVEGLTSKQKVALGFIWFVSGSYSLMSEQILSKEREVHCSLRSDLSDKFNFMSLFIAIGVPLVFGPMFCPIGHSILSIIACCKGVDANTCEPKDTKSSGLSDCGVITGFSFVFLIIYPVQMYVTEEYMANVQSMFVFMSFKYCYGCLHLILLPFIILLVKKDIRQAAIATYVKTNTEDGEITFEQLQEHVGIGVNPGM